MTDEPLPSTTACASERPPDGTCTLCNASVEPVLLPAFLEFPERWVIQPLCASCAQKREEESKILNHQAQLEEAFRTSCLSPRSKTLTFANFQPTPGTRQAYTAAMEYDPTKGGLLLFGSHGVGKTHLAAAIAQNQLGKVPTLFISCPEFLLELREEMSNRDHPRSRFQLAKDVQFLVLDDIGVEKPSEWVQQTLYVLINRRYELLLPTIFTSNYSLDELDQRLGKRNTSRLVEMCRCIHMGGEDWRIKKRKRLNQLVRGEAHEKNNS